MRAQHRSWSTLPQSARAPTEKSPAHPARVPSRGLGSSEVSKSRKDEFEKTPVGTQATSLCSAPKGLGEKAPSTVAPAVDRIGSMWEMLIRHGCRRVREDPAEYRRAGRTNETVLAPRGATADTSRIRWCCTAIAKARPAPQLMREITTAHPTGVTIVSR